MKPIAKQSGTVPKADPQREFVAGVLAKLDSIESAVAKLLAVIGQSDRIDAPASRFAARPATAPRIAPAAPEPQDVPEVARFSACGPAALSAAREALRQSVAIQAGPRGRAAVAKMGLATFIAQHPDVVAAVADSGVAPAPFRAREADVSHLVQSPRLSPYQSRGQSRERSPRGAA